MYMIENWGPSDTHNEHKVLPPACSESSSLLSDEEPELSLCLEAESSPSEYKKDYCSLNPLIYDTHAGYTLNSKQQEWQRAGGLQGLWPP